MLDDLPLVEGAVAGAAAFIAGLVGTLILDTNVSRCSWICFPREPVDTLPTVKKYTRMGFGRLTCSERWQCALIGGIPGWVAAVVVVLFGESDAWILTLMLFLPVTVSAGLVASYLWGRGTRESAVVGGFAGGVAVLPTILLPLIFFVFIFTWERGSAGWALVLFVTTAILFVVTTIVAAALGMLGGVIWARHADGGRDPGYHTDPRDAQSAEWGKVDRGNREFGNARSRQEPASQRTAGRKSVDVDRSGRSGDDDVGRATGESTTDGSKSLRFYGIVGGLLGMVLLPASLLWSPLVLVPSLLLPGGTAGYLQGSDRRDGAIAGAFAGAVTATPVVLFFLYVWIRGGFLAELDFILVVGLPLVVGFVTLGTLGGALGAIVTNR